MREWQRARLAKLCGYCGRVIAVGEPVLLRSLHGHSWQLARCEACAGEPAPELPAIESLPSAVRRTPVQPMLAVASLARDWKAAAVAEREPGEDG